MTLRQEIGIISCLTGILINIAHFALFFFSGKPEKYHGHEWIVGIGLTLVFGGLLLLIDKEKDQ